MRSYRKRPSEDPISLPYAQTAQTILAQNPSLRKILPYHPTKQIIIRSTTVKITVSAPSLPPLMKRMLSETAITMNESTDFMP